MKKNLMKIVSLILVLAMSLTISVPAFATGNTTLKTKTKECFYNDPMAPSKMFTDYISDYFKNHQTFKVVDKDQRDINETFYKDNLNNYLKSDFFAIRANVWNDVSCFCKETVTEEPYYSSTQNKAITPKSSFSRQKVSDRYYHVQTSYQADHNVEVFDTITGSFIYNVNTGVISQYTAPSLKVDYSMGGYDWNFYTKNISTAASLSSDKYKITFSASFDVEGSDNGVMRYDFGHIYDKLERSGS